MCAILLGIDETSFYSEGSGLNGFLFDENIPSRLTISPHLPVISSRDLGESVSDTLIWQYAQSKGYVIVTKDADFSNRIMIVNPPPWVVHLRIGNLRKRDFHSFIKQTWPQIELLLPAYKLINVYADRIEAIR